MTWAEWTITALLFIVACLLLALIWALDRRDTAQGHGATFRTARTRRRLRAMRRDLARARVVRSDWQRVGDDMRRAWEDLP